MFWWLLGELVVVVVIVVIVVGGWLLVTVTGYCYWLLATPDLWNLEGKRFWQLATGGW